MHLYHRAERIKSVKIMKHLQHRVTLELIYYLDLTKKSKSNRLLQNSTSSMLSSLYAAVPPEPLPP